MKTLQQIKDDVCTEYGWIDWACFRCDCDWIDQEVVLDEINRRYAIEVAKNALKNASDNVRIKTEEGRLYMSPYKFFIRSKPGIEYSIYIEKETITNPKNVQL